MYPMRISVSHNIFAKGSPILYHTRIIFITLRRVVFLWNLYVYFAIFSEKIVRAPPPNRSTRIPPSLGQTDYDLKAKKLLLSLGMASQNLSSQLKYRLQKIKGSGFRVKKYGNFVKKFSSWFSFALKSRENFSLS